MSARRRTPPPEPPPKAGPCVPALFFCALSAALIGLSLRKYWFPESALYINVYIQIFLIGLGGVLALLVAFWPWLRNRILDHFDNGDRHGFRYHRLCLGVAYLGLFAYAYFLKYCQYRGLQLTMDTTATANLVYNIAHSGSFASSVWGVSSYFAIHFMPGVAALAPLFWLWNDIQVLMIFQTILVSSLPIAVYLLAKKKSGSATCGWLAVWMVFTSPFYLFLMSSNIVFQVCLPAFFLWGAYAFETGRRKIAAACALAMLLTIEQTPVLFFGLGLYLLLRMEPRDKKAWLTAVPICAASALLFALEMRLIQSYPNGGTMRGAGFTHLAPTLSALALKMALEPMSIARAVLWPPSNLRPLFTLMLSGGGLFLFAPLECIPWAVNFIPHLLSTGYYHDLRLHYTAYMVGPFWWAFAAGLAKAYGWCDGKGRKHLTAALAFAVGIPNVFLHTNLLLPNWNRPFFSEMPVLAPMIPKDASVWAPEWLSPWVGCRSYVWPFLPGTDFAAPGLFMPDYILIQREWATTPPPGPQQRTARDTLFTILAIQGYAKVAERSSIIVLKHPNAPLAHGGPPAQGGPPPVLQAPKIDAALAAGFGAYLAHNDSLTETAALLRGMAEKGDEVGLYNLGYMTYAGQGVPQNTEEALRLWLLAAETGFVDAQYNAGTLYAERRDLPNAMKWYRAAAERGNLKAEFNLGVCLLKAPPPLQNQDEALKWFRQAAAAGYPPAQNALAQLTHGKG